MLLQWPPLLLDRSGNRNAESFSVVALRSILLLHRALLVFTARCNDGPEDLFHPPSNVLWGMAASNVSGI